jgi:hypothetical protein
MADVFISYASEDRDIAARLAAVLGARGLSVWWDRHIVIGEAFDHAIERELESAKSVVVLWSQHSTTSEWVKNEAAVAAERNVLLPALIAAVKLPLEFRRKQTADLSDWQGDTSHPGYLALLAGITATIGGAPSPPPQATLTPGSRPLPQQAIAPRRVGNRKLMTLVALAVLCVAIYAIGPWPTQVTDSDEYAAEATAAASPAVEAATPAEATTTAATNARTALADIAVGHYYGDVIADSKGSSRSDISVTINKIDQFTVQVTSDYNRIGSTAVTLTRVGNQLQGVESDSVFVLALDKTPYELSFNPRFELSYVGVKQQ